MNMIPKPAETTLERAIVLLGTRLPPGVSLAYLLSFVGRRRGDLIGLVTSQPQVAKPSADTANVPDGPAPDAWTPTARTTANLAAMQLAATKAPAEMAAEDLALLSRYSGWGGLSIDKVAPQLAKLPADFPRPETRGLIHEYYTPTLVATEVARAVSGFLAELPRVKGKVLALEPSAGIGRFVNATKQLPDLAWTAVEYSALSSKMLAAMRPDVHVWHGPFERWVREHSPKVAGKLGLVLSNPPYGARGAALTEDSDRSYREKKAYAYFLRRAADLLAPGGLGVFLIPSGFLSGQTEELRSLRENVLRNHHLVTAFRLPTGLFPGASLVTDLVFLQKRPGTLDAVHPDDASILGGGFFKDHPQLILGKEVGAPGDDDDQTAKPRWGYEVQGE
ncbi:MAG: N-6 DNA methylase, partial [Deltaproteobacteria bacterium]|nr:N-6 DNA methylase [Deltaproteobacteria bacterium]